MQNQQAQKQQQLDQAEAVRAAIEENFQDWSDIVFSSGRTMPSPFKGARVTSLTRLPVGERTIWLALTTNGAFPVPFEMLADGKALLLGSTLFDFEYMAYRQGLAAMGGEQA